jgi:glycosyltransferase involved in cell wall biosynthesis
MFKGQKVVVVMPAYNAEKTLTKTYNEVMDQQIVDEVIVVDDASRDGTVAVARGLPAVRIQVHEDNKGYGANQKTCYRLALDAGADIVIMVHPDYQYTPKLIPAMAAMIGNGLYHCVLGSRILGGYALRGGMPLWKYFANRFLTLSENVLVGAKLSEYHSGYRAFSRQLLEQLDLEQNSDDFVFDNQMLIQIIWHGYAIAEVTCPTDYNEEASSINFRRSVKYGFGCLRTALIFRLAKLGLYRSRMLSENHAARVGPERCPRDRRPDDRSLTWISVQGEGLPQNREGEGAPTVVGDIPPVTRPDIRPE